MPRAAISRIARQAGRLRATLHAPVGGAGRRCVPSAAAPRSQAVSSTADVSRRTFSVAARSFKGLTPDAEDPQPKPDVEINGSDVQAATELSLAEYHELSTDYLDGVMEKIEELQEHQEDIDFESAAGILNVTLASVGTWVINKQPPNRQIWLSSPVSGPKRYDWVVRGEGQDQKEGSGSGSWVYLRDGSSLSALLEKELGIDLTSTE